ncbi:HNH endonuclease [Elizabethkingia anophelis]|nr:HNH endonuclease [Elizabethkingia anophelis]
MDRYVKNSVGNGFRFIRGKKLKASIGTHGYKTISLKVNDKWTNKCIHRILAECFIPNPENKACVNHIDGNKFNNNLINLEWATFAENTQHAFRTGLQKPTKLSTEAKLKMSLSKKGKTPPNKGKNSKILMTCKCCNKEFMAYKSKGTMYCSVLCRGRGTNNLWKNRLNKSA